MNILGMGPLELLLIMGIALVVFGPDRLPELARQIGRAVGEMRRISNEVTGEFQRSLQMDDPAQRRTILRQPPPGQVEHKPAPTPVPPTEEIKPPY